MKCLLWLAAREPYPPAHSLPGASLCLCLLRGVGGKGFDNSPFLPAVHCPKRAYIASPRAPSAQVSVVDQLRLPIKFVGVGETQEDLQPFNAETFAEALFPKKEQ